MKFRSSPGFLYPRIDRVDAPQHRPAGDQRSITQSKALTMRTTLPHAGAPLAQAASRRQPRIRVTLQTASGRTCTGWLLHGDCDWTWDGPAAAEPPDDPTTKALFEHFKSAGDANPDAVEISGDAWRELEDNAGLHCVAFWVRRGASLQLALDAAVENTDPPSMSFDYEHTLERREQEIHALRAALQGLIGSSNGVGVSLEAVRNARRTWLETTPHDVRQEVIRQAASKLPGIVTFEDAIERFGSDIVCQVQARFEADQLPSFDGTQST